ncbi:MAG: phosphate ABC transporter permease subunit PstC [Hyphomicrobiaceae bacterium]
MLEICALVVVAVSLFAFQSGRRRARILVGENAAKLHSRPSYHGLYSGACVLMAGGAGLLALGVLGGYWIDASLKSALPDDIRQMSALQQDRILSDARSIANDRIVSSALNERVDDVRRALAQSYESWVLTRDWLVGGISVLFALLTLFLTSRQITHRFRARNRFEWMIQAILLVSALVAILTTVGIVLSLIGETVRFFSTIPIYKFLFGTHWSPLSGVFEGKINENSVGAIPLFAGTLLITFIAMLVAVPTGLLAAIYLSDYASATTRAWAKPLLELLAGIPTVVYGFFAAITVAPLIRGFGESIGLSVASESALAAGVVMGIMIIPFISSLSDDVINAVPQSLRDGSYGLGATKAETITRVILPAAMPGIVSAVLLGVSRAIGETMIVVMAAGQGANLTWNPLEAVTTVTVQIVALITGDTEADTAAGPAFALGFTLFSVTLFFNVIALRLVQKYRQKYD